jgi:hypothetical protein
VAAKASEVIAVGAIAGAKGDVIQTDPELQAVAVVFDFMHSAFARRHALRGRRMKRGGGVPAPGPRHAAQTTWLESGSARADPVPKPVVRRWPSRLSKPLAQLKQFGADAEDFETGRDRLLKDFEGANACLGCGSQYVLEP